ncbi:HAD superfamily hydrolase Cof domain protein [Mycoplasmoides gallisepticum CA06_2006.052-5-2P]|uniref:HAD superfamily hydrolase Cof domain protein n=1 Tax=Mycoplasmoides gallisepticum WI01_2001.043-13-2P TaxID=1159201 RepID=J3TRQ1_MYCGL|nr:HAD superfamily hydrolase Cof domain protein [Mycoplasmoides gallisepticum VA94_7994-1-7P]AFP77097.1 HAD superfamily hydrolase Cof domain protein [Mycoplasmoides gallisepticum NC95_13295-2-2P]AFP77855.1 HAD superfamily hydrolase Cof domain protein [Mycoplasmoides gallisepticum NC96_1596-4-2P]AFP79382.1 HAD superfamily hydrolase Cof domain protein [Mycoplasmoides gallisepticum WI01_2001.043-13-2P]AFP80871.1 HAD superfamily hydrolase Cof domain protein [Mycoplasmoides gallisepticum CA06_2006.0
MYFRTYLRKTKSSKKSNYTKLASLPHYSEETLIKSIKIKNASIDEHWSNYEIIKKNIKYLIIIKNKYRLHKTIFVFFSLLSGKHRKN